MERSSPLASPKPQATDKHPKFFLPVQVLATYVGQVARRAARALLFGLLSGIDAIRLSNAVFRGNILAECSCRMIRAVPDILACAAKLH